MGIIEKQLKTYVKASNNGYLFLWSKEPRQGYKEVESKDGKKSYHKILDGVKGHITDLQIRTSNFTDGDVRFISLDLSDSDGETVNILTPLDSASGLSRISKAFINSAYNLDFDKEVLVKLYKKKNKSNGNEYENLTWIFIYGKDDYSKFISFDNVPTPTKKKKSGKDVWDYEAQDDYYFGLLTELIERFKGHSSDSTDTTEEEHDLF